MDAKRLVALPLVGDHLSGGHPVERHAGQRLRISVGHAPPAHRPDRPVEDQPVGIGKLSAGLRRGAFERFLAGPVDRHLPVGSAAGAEQEKNGNASG